MAQPYIAARSPEARRQLAGPTLGKDEIYRAAAARAAQIEAGAQINEIMKDLEKKAERARERKAAKARKNQCRLDERPSASRRRRSEKFVSLPSGLTLSKSDLAKTKRRASSHFGCGPRLVAKEKQAASIKPAPNPSVHSDTARRASVTTPRRTSKSKKSKKSSAALCLC
ncbi:hypothetical protein E4U42_003028 [Claviceps africana]|uniref:Uncharacterized protein n=1 Tax=Claviceps africana TaxID=83212 RepID=A0A8K0J7I1_9HYPO|nr:hypothetical protein E4U42_003028 [Claviceps africana]